MSSSKIPSFPQPDQNFDLDLDFTSLGPEADSDVLENFDFDSFLNTEATAPASNTKATADSFYTISEDLAEGKLTQKENGLKTLVKTVQLSGFAHDKLGDQRTPEKSLPQASTASMPLQHVFHDRPSVTPTTAILNDSSVTNNDAWGGKRKRKANASLADGWPKRAKADTNPPAALPITQKDDTYASKFTKTIYMIHCKSGISEYHKATAYKDRPFFPTHRDKYYNSDMVHANGLTPIYDLVSYFKEEENNTAITVVRHVRCEENQQLQHDPRQLLKWYESVAVSSPVVRQALSHVAQCHYQGNNDVSTRNKATDELFGQLTLSPPKLFLFHHQELLADYIKDHPDALEHVSALLHFCEKKYGSDFKEARSLFDKGLVSQKHLEKLYRPNDIVISHQTAVPTAYVLSDWPVTLVNGTVKLSCWNWRNNGSGWHRNACDLYVPTIPLSTPMAVKVLEICPASFVSQDTWDMLETRGVKVWNMKDRSYVAYTGYDAQGEDFYPESRFMIDYAVYKKMHEYASALQLQTVDIRRHDPWPQYLSTLSEPSAVDLVVMPSAVHGFYLTEKQWICIDVDGIHDIKWNKTAYDRLVIPDESKVLIQALVTVRKSQKGVKHGLGVAGKRVDIIAGKGNGLIMLLHGGPGTGKSLTAESVAEIAEMPLYRVTCGDIGTTPEAVEKYMGTVMHLGVTWNCVLLLDEADVFLEERSMSDLARNSLVSVFLRTLEYYDGILILTSNRIGMFDEAFKSRIQVALHYEKLNKASRKKVWANFIDMLEEDEEDVDFQEIRYKLDQLAQNDLNGRQIRNTLTTARQLALFQARRLDWQHIQQALSVSLDFNSYIQTMQGHTDDQEARDRNLR